MKFRQIHIVINFLGPQMSADIWRVFNDFLESQGILPKKFEVAGSAKTKYESDLNLSPNEIDAYLAQNTPQSMTLTKEHRERGIRIYFLSGSEESHIRCHFGGGLQIPVSWALLVEKFTNRFPLIGAWLYLTKYQTWQNILDVDVYKAFYGELPSGFRTFPDPNWSGISQQSIHIDNSKNPGRYKKFNMHFDFYPTAEMWLGPTFWRLTTCTREEALAAGFWLEVKDTPQFAYFKCWPQPFTRPDGEQGRMQQRIWKLFFQEDCEWPPGSGGISDIPVYGPPELMPAPPPLPKDS